MKLIPSTLLVCVGIYVAFNHPDVAQVMYGYFMQGVNYLMVLVGKAT